MLMDGKGTEEFRERLLRLLDERSAVIKLSSYYQQIELIHPFFVRQAKEECSKAIEAYDRIIKNTSLFLGENGAKDEFDVLYMTDYGLFNGYFSINNSYIHSISGRKHITGYFGLNIMTGKGVCRENAEFLTNIVNEMGYFGIYTMSFADRVPSVDYNPDIKLKRENPVTYNIALMIARLNPSYYKANHAVVLIEKDGNYYALDPTHFCVFKLDASFKAHLLHGAAKLSINPEFTIAISVDNKEKVNRALSSYTYDKDTYITEEYLREKSESVLDFCKSNVHLFRDFHSEIRSDIELIDTEIKQYRK